MKKRTAKSKTKAPQRASRKKASAPEQELPDLVAAMLKLTERLESLEKKMDIVVSQTAVRGSSDHRPAPNYNPRPQSHMPAPAPSPAPAPQGNPGLPQNTGHHHGQGRTLYKAVCADCQAECEVPFKPVPERATYCKACFAKRKEERRNGGGQPHSNQNQPREVNGNTLHEPKRHVRVIRKGVGRVTISDFARPGHGHAHGGGNRHHSHRPKFAKSKRR